MHGLQGCTDSTVAQRSQPTNGAAGLPGVETQHVNEKELREMIKDELAGELF